MDKYDHKKIEQKWQKEWADKKLYETPDSKAGAKNYYQLVELVVRTDCAKIVRVLFDAFIHETIIASDVDASV